MSDQLELLAGALEGQYAIERELGAAVRAVRRYGGTAVGDRRA